MADPDKVFNIEVADRLSQGCGRHADPACLCDVDVALTADIKWRHGPSFLLGAETSVELTQRWADYVYHVEIEGPRRALRPMRDVNMGDQRAQLKDEICKQVQWPQLTALSDDERDALVAELLAGKRAIHVAADWGLSSRSVVELGAALGATHRAPASAPWRLYACNRYADGAGPAQIAREIAEEWGDTPTQQRVYQIVSRAGIERGSAA